MAIADLLVEEGGVLVKPVRLEHGLIEEHTGGVAVGHTGGGIVLHP